MTHRGESVTAQPFFFALALGTLAGAALIVTSSLVTRGQAIFIPYAALIASLGIFLRRGRIARFGTRFAMALGAFMVASLLLYLFIATVPTDGWRAPLQEHAWRLAFLLAVGAPLSAAVAKLSAPRP